MKKLINSFFVLVFVFAFTNLSAQEIVKWKLNDLKAAIRNADKPTVFNFWATFCKPCVAELPHFQQIVKSYEAEGVKLILVSLDLKEAYPKKIKAFAAQHSFSAPVFFLDETDADLFCPAVDKSWSGSIPASLFINNKKGYHKFFEEELKKEVFEKEIQAMLAIN